MSSLSTLERGLRLLELAAELPDGFTWSTACQELTSASTATVARLLGSLVEGGYLLHVKDRYLFGPAMQALVPAANSRDVLSRKAGRWATRLSRQLRESVVVASYGDGYCEFIGVSQLEGSVSSAGVGHRLVPPRGHVLSMPLLLEAEPNQVKADFEAGNLTWHVDGRPPRWPDYHRALLTGGEEGVFCEYEWCRQGVFRVVVPIFDEDGHMIGACMCAQFSQQDLDGLRARLRKAVASLHDELPGPPASFDCGLERLTRRAEAWRAPDSMPSTTGEGV